MSRVLIVSHEALHERMSGPSIRNWELAGALAARHDVTLAVPGRPQRVNDRFAVRPYNRATLKRLVADHEIVQCYGFLLHQHPTLLEAQHLVVDLYGPFELESLHMNHGRAIAERVGMARSDRMVLGDLVLAGDVFLCASDRQRDFWLGWLDAAGRINPHTHTADPGLASLVRQVPFGLPEDPPVPGPPLFRGRVPGIGRDDFMVLWGGGIWNWFDPLTLIRAAAATERELPQLRVVFPAPASPSEVVPRMAMSGEARRLSAALGMTGRRVFFGDAWVPYDDRGRMFLEADLGVSLHRDDVETRFSFRTRVLDYLWAGLPILTTEGDSMADLVRTERLGAVVGYGDEHGVARALVRLAGDPDGTRRAAERSAKVARRFRWSEVARPLLDYCDQPLPAADRELARGTLAVNISERSRREPLDPTLRGPAEFSRLWRRTLETMQREGAGSFWAKGQEYFRRRRRTG